MKKSLCIFIALVLLAGLISFPPAARAEESAVRVLLSTEGRDTLTLTLSGAYSLQGAELSGGVLTVAVSGTEVVATHSELGELFTGEKITLTSLSRENLFALATAGGKERLYRGDASFSVADGAVRVVNTVGMEDYMLGAAIGEVGKDAPEALLKAGLIAAKNYALAEIGVRGSKAYDVDDTHDDQLYRGFDASATKAIACAAQVADQTLLYNGQAIKAHYGASNGGVVLTPKAKWGGSQAYSGAYECKFDPFDITRSDAVNLMIPVSGEAPETLPEKLYSYLLSKTGGNAITAITDLEGYSNGDHPKGYAPQDGFRITLRVSGGGTQTVDVTFDELSKNKVVLSDNSVAFAAKVKDGSWMLCWGKSSGPRVGMSHSGAKRMAEMGYSYVDILKFYYPNAELTKNDGSVVRSKADLSTEAIMTALGGAQNRRITKTLWVTTGGTEIMSKASGSADVCARLPFKSQFGVYEKSGDWYYGIDPVTGVQGWITKKSLSADEPKAEPTPDATPEPVAASASPTDTPPATVTLSNPIAQNDPVSASTEAAEGTVWLGVLNKDKVNLRKKPSSNAGSVASGLKIGTAVTVYGEEDGFYYVSVDETGKTGYINKEYVFIIGQVDAVPGEPVVDPAGEILVTLYGVLNKNKVILRKGPDSSFNSVAGNLTKGTAVTIFKEVEGFYFVRIDESGLYGYINMNYVDLVEAPEPTPVPAPTETPEPTPTATPEPTPTATPEPTPTATPEPTPTATPEPEPTETPEPEPTETPEPDPTATPEPDPTETPEPDPTETPEPTPTATPGPTPERPYTEPTQDMIDNALVGVLNKDSVILRKGPTVDYNAVASGITIGSAVTVYVEDGDFYFLRVDKLNKYGYINKRYVVIIGEANPSPDDPLVVDTVNGTLNKNSVNLRRGPGSDYGTVSSGLTKGTAVTIYLEDSGFYFLRVDKTGKYGYVNKNYVDLEGAALPTPTPTATPKPTPSGPYTEPTWQMIENSVDGVLINGGVNMRKGPGTNYGLVDSGLKKGTTVTVFLKDGDWYFLQVDDTGKYGYIYADYIELVDDDDPKPTKKPTEEPAIRLSQGDVNGDGLVSAADAALILRYDAGIIDLTDAQLKAADMDGDKQVTDLDAKALLKYVAGRLAR